MMVQLSPLRRRYRRLTAVSVIAAALWLLGALLPGAARAQDAAATPTAEPARTHTVVAGDTLYGIAQQYGVTVAALQQLNNLPADAILSIGQTLLVSGVPALPLGARVIDDPALLQHPDLPPVPKRHLVQAGETLFGLAEQYNVALGNLVAANQLDPDAPLSVGRLLTIPGAPGELIAFDYTVQLGDTIAGIAAAYNSRPDLLTEAGQTPLNPHALVVGQRLPIVSRSGSADPLPIGGAPHVVQPGETLSLIANRHKLPPTALAAANGLPFPTPVYPGQRLRVPGAAPYRPLPGAWRTVALSDPVLTQGETFSLYVETDGAAPSGALAFVDLAGPAEPFYYAAYTQTFPFHPYRDGYVAIVGLDAFVSPGLYTLTILPADGGRAPFEQMVSVRSGNYGAQQIAIPDERVYLLAPEVRALEDSLLAPLYEQITPTATWILTEPLRAPLDQGYLTARYGAARSYNNGPYELFHNGIDFAAPVQTPVLAAADGVVVFSDVTNLRGNLVIIDHGWGVMTAYYHLAQRLVAAGDRVTAGQAIGGLGNTGLSSGAHLHWDVRVRNVPVNGLQWLQRAFP